VQCAARRGYRGVVRPERAALRRGLGCVDPEADQGLLSVCADHLGKHAVARGGLLPVAFVAHVRRVPEANAPKTPSPPSPPSRNPTPARASPSLVSTRPGVRAVLPWVVSTVLILGVGNVVADKFFASKRAAPTSEVPITGGAKRIGALISEWRDPPGPVAYLQTGAHRKKARCRE
jgi:hypothetical protein